MRRGVRHSIQGMWESNETETTVYLVVQRATAIKEAVGNPTLNPQSIDISKHKSTTALLDSAVSSCRWWWW